MIIKINYNIEGDVFAVKNKKLVKKFISTAMSGGVVISSLPVYVLAVGGENSGEEVDTETIDIGNIRYKLYRGSHGSKTAKVLGFVDKYEDKMKRLDIPGNIEIILNIKIIPGKNVNVMLGKNYRVT